MVIPLPPTTPSRERLIERLESLGFDDVPGVPHNWRAALADAELSAAIAALTVTLTPSDLLDAKEPFHAA